LSPIGTIKFFSILFNNGNPGHKRTLKLATCTWGFSMENDKFMMYHINWDKPSQQHINQMFNQYGIKLIYP